MFAISMRESKTMLGVVALVAMLSLTLAGTALAATYYVNSAAAPGGDGSQAAPWNTLKAADDAMLAPGDVVLCTGTFDVGAGNGFNPILSNGTAEAHITYKAAGTCKVVGTNIDMLIEADYIDVDGFEISGGLIGLEYYMSKAGNVTNCVIHDCKDRGIAIDGGIGGNQASFETGIVAVFRKNLIYNIAKNGSIGWGAIHVFHTNGAQLEILNNTTIGGIVGIIIGENTDMNVQIRNNIMANALYGLDYVARYGSNNSYVNSHNLFYGNTNDYLYDAKAGEGEFNANPLFVNAAAYDYHLTECTSPAINKGFIVPWYVEGIDYVFPRPDMGCFETGCIIPPGHLKGRITDARNGDPIAGVKVTNGLASGETDANGYYDVSSEAGTFTFYTVRTGFEKATATDVMIVSEQDTMKDFVLNRKAPTSYYVDNALGNDANDGTAPDKAWKTIARGDELGVVSAGDTVYVAAGTYAQTSADGVWLKNCSGDVEGNITYKATGTVLIDQSAYLSGEDVVRGFRADVSYVTIDGFEIINCNRGIDFWTNRWGNEVANCKIHDLANGTLSLAQGILLLVNSNCYIHNNLFYNIGTSDTGGACVYLSQQNGATVDNNTMSNCVRGFYIETSGGMAYVRNNIITGTGVGVMIASQRDVVRAGNLFYNNSDDVVGVAVEPLLGVQEFRANPLLDGDYKPIAGSPAINTGVDVNLDYQGPAPDRGFFETSSTAAASGIAGTVKASMAGNPPIPGATVESGDNSVFAITGPDGGYWLPFAPGSHDIHAFADYFDTQYANGVAVVAGQVTTQDFVLNRAPGATYYVSAERGEDHYDGSYDNPWKTIQNGEMMGWLQPGDTVMILPGIYDTSQFGQLGITLSTSGASTLVPITYKAQPEGGLPAIIDGAGTSFGFVIGSSYIVLDGLEVRNCLYGIDFNSGVGCRATNCYMHDITNAALYSWATYKATFDHNVTNNCGTGVYPQGSSSASVFNNTIVGGVVGIDFTSTANGVAANNIIGGVTMGIAAPCQNNHNMFYGNTNNYVLGAQAGVGDFNVDDPMFVGAPDFHLQTGSPAIDKGGKLGYAYSGLAPDCGAFESSETVAPIPTAMIADLKSVADGMWVEISDAKIATAASSTFVNGSYYIEEPDRSSGIKLIPQAGIPAVAIGNPLTLFGILGTDAAGERYIDVASVLPSTQVTPVASLGVLNRALVAAGPSTTGLLVRVWGKVTYKALDGSYIYVDDGSGVLDSSGRTGVRVILAGLTDPVTKAIGYGDEVGITGLAGLAQSGSGVIPVVRTRGDADIRVF